MSGPRQNDPSTWLATQAHGPHWATYLVCIGQHNMTLFLSGLCWPDTLACKGPLNIGLCWPNPAHWTLLLPTPLGNPPINKYPFNGRALDKDDDIYDDEAFSAPIPCVEKAISPLFENVNVSVFTMRVVQLLNTIIFHFQWMLVKIFYH